MTRRKSPPKPAAAPAPPPASPTKGVEFLGTSLKDLKDFPQEPREEAGFQLYQVQCGLDPDDWKPMGTIGAGVAEIKIKDASGEFRVLYVAKFSDVVYVLHCFQKKTQKTPKRDIDLATQRYKEIDQ